MKRTIHETTEWIAAVILVCVLYLGVVGLAHMAGWIK